MNLAVVNEAVTEMNGVEHQFTEEEKNFVVQFAFRSGSKEDTISLIEALAHSADKAESDEIMVTYRAKYDMKPAWVEQVENLLVALEMYRIEEEKAINHLADILTASYSAINKNVEMMLWLGTKNMYLNGDKFLEDIFCGPVGDAKNPFEQVTVADAVLETESDNRNLLEQKIKDLCRVKRQAVIQEDNENAGKYKIVVEFSGIESDSEVTVSPFNSKQEQTLSEHIEFSELEILQLSEFYEITARSGDDTIRRIIMIPTSSFPDDRESGTVLSHW